MCNFIKAVLSKIVDSILAQKDVSEPSRMNTPTQASVFTKTAGQRHLVATLWNQNITRDVRKCIEENSELTCTCRLDFALLHFDSNSWSINLDLRAPNVWLQDMYYDLFPKCEPLN